LACLGRRAERVNEHEARDLSGFRTAATCATPLEAGTLSRTAAPPSCWTQSVSVNRAPIKRGGLKNRRFKPGLLIIEVR